MRLIDADALKKALAKMWYDSQISITGISVSELIDSQPTIAARPTGEWSTHEVACLLADAFGDTCACNYNNIDEWLPSVCEFANTECPHPVGVACWEQFVTYKFADMRGGEDE